MRFIIPFVAWVFLVLSCTEPFEVERKGSLMILDGKISTELGESFIRIYDLNEDGTSTAFNDFDIKVIDTDGQEFSFTSLDTSTNTFVPSSFGFIAQEGLGYKVIATQADGLRMESTFDYVAEKIDFDFNIGDTTVVVQSQQNEPINRSATSAIASISFEGDHLFSKMEFEYRYEHLISLDSIIIKQNDFVLFACDDSNNCQDSIDVTAGYTTQFEWFFLRRNRYCDSIASVTQINFVENCGPESGGCCEYREDWPTIFQLRVEALSKESYGFWKDLEKLTTGNGLIFDTFPFPVAGNVTCDGCDGNFFGLLRASSEITKEQIVIL